MFRNLMLSAVLALSAVAAFAIPKPSEVKAAFAAGNYMKAETMLKEVMAERPTAPVHYQLGQAYAAQGKHDLALNEYRQAQVLDPTLKFASNAQEFTKRLGTEQTLVAPPATVAQSVPMINYSTVRETAQPLPAVHESSGIGMIFLIGMAIVLLGGGALYLFWGRREKQLLVDNQTADSREKMSTLLGFAKSLEDALLIAKTGTYSDAMKRRIMDRIQALQTTVRGMIGELKDGKPLTSTRLATLETNVNNAVDDANNGETAHAVPDPTYVPTTGGNSVDDVAARIQSRFAPSPSFAPSPTQSIHHYPAPAPAPVIVNNSNDGLLTGVLIGSMMNHHEDRTVYVDRTPRYEAPAPSPRYDAPAQREDTYEAPAPAPYEAPQLDTSSSDSSDSYSSSSDSSSVDSSSSDTDSY